MQARVDPKIITEVTVLNKVRPKEVLCKGPLELWCDQKEFGRWIRVRQSNIIVVKIHTHIKGGLGTVIDAPFETEALAIKKLTRCGRRAPSKHTRRLRIVLKGPRIIIVFASHG